jgi:hypothetical protein
VQPTVRYAREPTTAAGLGMAARRAARPGGGRNIAPDNRIATVLTWEKKLWGGRERRARSWPQTIDGSSPCARQTT